MTPTILLWVVFNLFVLGMLALDLGVFHRRAHAVSLREAGVWTAIWIALALVFNVGVYMFRGPEPALEFLTAYLIEKSLSVDNIFVFLVIFTYFAVPAALSPPACSGSVLSTCCEDTRRAAGDREISCG